MGELLASAKDAHKNPGVAWELLPVATLGVCARSRAAPVRFGCCGRSFEGNGRKLLTESEPTAGCTVASTGSVPDQVAICSSTGRAFGNGG